MSVRVHMLLQLLSLNLVLLAWGTVRRDSVNRDKFIAPCVLICHSILKNILFVTVHLFSQNDLRLAFHYSLVKVYYEGWIRVQYLRCMSMAWILMVNQCHVLVS